MYFQKPPLGTPLNFEHPLNKGCILHLAMNEGNGDKVRDLSMYGNHGTLHDFAFPPTVASGWNPGRTRAGLNFDGVNDWLDCGNRTIADISGEMTLSAWVMEFVENALAVGIVEKNAMSNGYLMRIATGVPQFFLRSSGDVPPYVILSANGKLTLNTWTHIACTRDGNNDMWTYVNGVKQAATANFVSVLDPSGDDIIVGRYDERSFNGSIDEVRIHNHAMTAKEVLDCYINPYQVYLDEDD